MSLRSVHHLKRRLHIVLTNSTTAKVSNPLKTRSTFSAATSASPAVNVVLKAHSTSPIPAHEPHCQNLWEQGRHWSLGRPTLHIPFVKTHKLHTSMSARCPFDDQDACLTGSGIFLCSSSSTCTVVGKLCTGSHSPSFTTSPPPTWVNVQPSCSSLDAVIGGGLSRCQDRGHGECERASFGVDTASASVRRRLYLLHPRRRAQGCTGSWASQLVVGGEPRIPQLCSIASQIAIGRHPGLCGPDCRT